MSRINTNISSLVAQRTLATNNQNLNKSLERLSTGYRINSGGDDPAGLIVSERLRSEKVAISSAIANAERADQVVNIAEGGLQEISSMLLEVQSLIGQSANEAGLSTDEKNANQQQIDSLLASIDRIAEVTNFQGSKLLNGSFDFTVSGQVGQVDGFTINAAKLNPGENRDVQVLVTTSAQRGYLFLSTGGSQIDLSASTASFSIEVAGANGTRQFSFASGTTHTAMRDTINSFKTVTGVSATVSGGGLKLASLEYGSKNFVQVDVIDDAGLTGKVKFVNSNDTGTAITVGEQDFSAVTNPIRDAGQDIGAIINGLQATSDGRTARVANEFLDMSVTLSAQASGTLASLTAFTITGGGATFNIGPKVDIANQVRLGIGNVAARKLGSLSSGFLDTLGSGKANNVVDGNLTDAQTVVNEAITQVSSLRGRLGAFQRNVLQTTVRSLGVAYENTAAAESAIRDTDFAKETAELTRNQILVQASTNALAITRSNPQNVLQLLG